MELALVKLEKKRAGQTYYILDYVSADIARLGVEINGADHGPGEYSRAEIIRTYDSSK